MSLPRSFALLLLGSCSALAAQLGPFRGVDVRNGLSRTVIIQPSSAGSNYTVTDRSDLLASVDDGILTLKPNMTATTATQTDISQVITAVTSGLLSGLLNPQAATQPVAQTSTGTQSKTSDPAGPIRVRLPASALASVTSESSSVDVVIAPGFASRSVAITQTGGAKLVALQLDVANVTASAKGLGPLYLMGSMRNVSLSSTGPGPVYIGSSAKQAATLGAVNITARGPMGSGDIIVNPDNTNATITGSQAVQPILYSRGDCSVTAQVVNTFGVVGTSNICLRTDIRPPAFALYQRLAAEGAASPAGAPAAAPMGQIGYSIAAAPAPGPLLVQPVIPAAAPADALIMAPLAESAVPAAAPADLAAAAQAPTVAVLELAPAPGRAAPLVVPATPALQQIQPVSSDSPAPALAFFPATRVTDDTSNAPAPAPQNPVTTLPLRRLLRAAA